MGLEAYKYYNRVFNGLDNYYELGYSIGGYHWFTLKGTLDKPADELILKIPYSVITYSNTYGVVVNQSTSYPGNSSTGRISSDIVNGKFSSGEGRNPGGTTQGWNDFTATVTLKGKFNAGVNYVHVGLLAGTTVRYGALDIWAEGSTLTVSKNRTYTIQYNANNGSGAPSSSTKTHATALKLSTTIPTRPGYTFVNWNTASNGTGTSYAAGATFTREADTTLYAQWEINTLTIKMDVNGGKKASESLSNMTISNGIALYDGKSQSIKYGESFHLWNYNNPSQINLRRPGYIISQGKEFCSTNDGTGIIYDQARQYDITDFTDITYESKTITLYVNWKTGGIVYISDGSQWIPYQAYYSNGSSWEHVMPYISNGSEWIQYT